MACPTCDHTVQSLSDGWWWCPRCGSLLHHSYAATPLGCSVPSAVGYAREICLGDTSEKRRRDLAEAVGVKVPPPEPTIDDVDGLILAADLNDRTDRKMLHDALMEAGRDAEAAMLVSEDGDVFAEMVDGRPTIAFRIDLPF